MDDAKKKRFWVGDPDGFGMPDDDQVEGSLTPDEDGNVYLNRKQPEPKQPKQPKRRDGSQRPRP